MRPVLFVFFFVPYLSLIQLMQSANTHPDSFTVRQLDTLALVVLLQKYSIQLLNLQTQSLQLVDDCLKVLDDISDKTKNLIQDTYPDSDLAKSGGLNR
jgi:hypothetical protein